MHPPLTRVTPYKQRAGLQIECPSCRTAYSAARIGLLMDDGSGTVKCMVCPRSFDVEITRLRTLLGLSSALQVVTSLRDE